MKVCILNYNSGNVKSVYNMFATITDNVVISNSAQDILSATHLVLPGVGAFGASMEKIKKNIPLDIVEKEVITRGKPFLGICVGMQVLAQKGFEFGECAGLGWIAGTVEKMETKDFPLPHIGWNNIEIKKDSLLLSELNYNQDFYFVHSFSFREENPADVVAVTEYGHRFTSIISKNNIFGVQFHPEKSQQAGKILLRNFLKIS